MALARLFLSVGGRIPRRLWWLGVIATALPVLPFAAAEWPMGESLASLAMLVPQFAVDAKRLHDRGYETWVAAIPAGLSALLILDDHVKWLEGLSRPAWTVIVSALVVIGLWFIVELGFRRGVARPNAHGPDPLDSASP